MKRSLIGLTVIATLSTGDSALSADVLLRAYAAHRDAYGPRELATTPRPPSAIPDLADRPSTSAVSALNVRDSHVLEFLRWKEHLRTEIRVSRLKNDGARFASDAGYR
jgi:hypothetical protein